MRSDASQLRSRTFTLVLVATAIAWHSFPAALPAVQVGVAPGGTAQAPEAPKGTGLLMGRLLDAATKQPIAGAIVNISGGALTTTVLPSGEVVTSLPATTATGAPATAPRQILTDASGRFLFRDLAQGRYSIRATSPGYIASTFGQSQPNGLSQTIELTRDDEKRGGLTVLMWKTATITGRVTDETGDPVVGQQVRAYRKTMTGGRTRLSSGTTAATDDRGVYRFGSLAPGDYLVGVVTTQTTFPAATADAYTQLMTSGSTFTSSEMFRELSSSNAPQASTGGYRIGDLVLQATPAYMASGAPIPPPSDSGVVLAYPARFYPSASVASEATVLTLTSGEERPGIDLHLRLSRTVRVSGIVTGPDGPVRNLGLRLLPAGADDFIYTTETGIEAAATATDAKGEFTFLGVTPGAYVLRALRVPRPMPSGSPTAGMTMIEVTGAGGLIMGMSSSGPGGGAPVVLPTEPTLSGSMAINAGESDVTGLTFVVRPGARISGRLVFEGGRQAPAPEQLQRASISISPLNVTAPIQILTAARRLEPDGRFNTVGYPQGRYTVSASMPIVPGDPTRWRFRSATLGGRDVSEGLDVLGEDISDLVVTFTDRTQELSGIVTTAAGQPDTGASVFIFPADTQAGKQGQLPARRARALRTSTTGKYSFPDIPPGAYFVAATRDVSTDNWQTPRSLEALASVATRLTVTEGQNMSQDLRTASVR